MRRDAHCFVVETRWRTQPIGKPFRNPHPRQTPASMKPSCHICLVQAAISERRQSTETVCQ